MRAIEFTTIIKNGKIEIPERYKQLANRLARIIVLTEEESEKEVQTNNSLNEVLTRLQQRNVFSDIQDPVQWQRKLRDEWE